MVGSLFADLERRAARWQRTRGSVPVQRFGTAAAAEPLRAPAVDLERLLEAFRLGSRELGDIWTWVLPARAIVELRKLADAPAAAFRVDDGLSARVVYDFALAYRLRVLHREHLLRSLVPLYSGWLASFILQVRELGAEAVEARVEELAAAFEAQKPYLISRWHPRRTSPPDSIFVHKLRLLASRVPPASLGLLARGARKFIPPSCRRFKKSPASSPPGPPPNQRRARLAPPCAGPWRASAA